MKKKLLLALLSLAPILLGYGYNALLSADIAFDVVAYVVPVLVLAFWFWTGTRFAAWVGRFPLSLLLAHFPGLLLFLLYLWQFVWTAEAARNTILATASQMFSAGVTLFVAPAAILVNGENITQATATVTQVLGLLFLGVVFSLGFSWKRKNP